MAMLTVQDVYDRLELGLTAGDDTDADAFVQRQIDAVSQAIENHLGRRLDQASYVETIRYPSEIILVGWPIQSVTTIVADGDTLVSGTGFEAIADTGELRRLSGGELAGRGWWGGTKLLVATYSGGYATVPEDVLRVFDIVIGHRWNQRAAAGTVAAAIGSTPSVRKVTMADVGSIEYGGAVESATAASEWLSGFPLAALDHYSDPYRWIVEDYRQVVVS